MFGMGGGKIFHVEMPARGTLVLVGTMMTRVIATGAEWRGWSTFVFQR